jgi:alkylhydroperoxidase family enzyme
MSFGAPSEHVTDERTLLAIGLAHAAMEDPHSIHPDSWSELKQHFSDRELVELCYLIAFYSGNQLFNVLLDPEIETAST